MGIQMYFGGALINGSGIICLGLSSFIHNQYLSLFCSYMGGMGGAISMSQSGAIVASFTDVSNRGRIFGLIQTFQNVGKIIGPMVATNVAVHGVLGIIPAFFGLPFCISGSCVMTAGCVMLASTKFAATPQSPSESKIVRKATSFGAQWEN